MSEITTNRKSNRTNGQDKEQGVPELTRKVRVNEGQIGLLNAILGIDPKINPTSREVEFEIQTHEDKRVILIPEYMSKLQAAEHLAKEHENEEQEIQVTRMISGYYYKDTLVAIKKVSSIIFGWIEGKIVRSFFGDTYPEEIDITVDIINGKQITEKAFLGRFNLAIYEDAKVDIAIKGFNQVEMTCYCKKKYSEVISEYFSRVQDFLLTNSIYKGKSVVVTSPDKGILALNLTEVKVSKGIFLNETERQTVQYFILDELESKGKRAYLLTGDYGNGKTETAMRIGKAATQEGMTFFYVKDASLFDQVIVQAKQYGSSVVFLEDLDEIGSGEERTSAINRILNTIDGVETKGSDIKIIFTTNHEQKINSALRRPGRIDIIVKFDNPDASTRELILSHHFSKLNGSETLNYPTLSAKFPDVQGAVVTEICTRAVTLSKKDGFISEEKVVAAIGSMRDHIEFMKKEQTVTPNIAELFISEVASKVKDSLTPEFNDIQGFMTSAKKALSIK